MPSTTEENAEMEELNPTEEKQEEEEEEKDAQVQQLKPTSSSELKEAQSVHKLEAGESSKFSTDTESDDHDQFVCKICAEPKSQNDSLTTTRNCVHSFCSECTVKHITTRLQENPHRSIRCPEPDCNAALELTSFHSVLPKTVFETWCDALCEVLIHGSQRFYCPYKDCSGLLVVDEGDNSNSNNMVVKESECPYCHRLFCAQCNVSWHSGIECEEYQELNENERGKEDLMVMELAKEMKWQRCPMCRFYVERTEGCLFIQCRCGSSFCYNCGAPMEGHYCNNCKH